MNIYTKDECTGEEQEFKVLGSGGSDHWDRERATHFITGTAEIQLIKGHHLRAEGCMYLQRVGKWHTFGTLTYEETGERRCYINAGEYYLSSCGVDMVACRTDSTRLQNPVTILRPIKD